MDQKDLEKFKNRLLVLRREVLSHMRDIQEEEQEASIKEATGENSSYTFHLADQGTNTYNQDNHFRSIERDCQSLYFIDQALEKIEDLTYGYCEDCGNSINSKRLEVIPHTSYCFNCQSKQEGNNFPDLDSFEQTSYSDDSWDTY